MMCAWVQHMKAYTDDQVIVIRLKKELKRTFGRRNCQEVWIGN